MIGRILWCAGLLGVALSVSAAQIDRQSRFDPEFSALVPDGFRGFSQVHLARAAMAGDNPQIAQDQTRELVRVRPIPAEHLSALAVAASVNGDEQTAIQALEAAASRGWREPVSQTAVVEASLLSGNYDQAAQRLIALWLVDNGQERLVNYTARLFETAEGRAAFSRFLPSSQGWRRNFVAQMKGALDPEIIEQVISQAKDNSSQ